VTDRKHLVLKGPVGTALVRLAMSMMHGNLQQIGYQLTDAFGAGRLAKPATRG